MQTYVYGSFEISKDALNQFPVGECRIVHELGNIIDTIREVWSCESKVLESPNNASISSFRKELVLDPIEACRKENKRSKCIFLFF